MDSLTFESFFTEFSELFWLTVGFLLIAIELSVAPGIGMLFAGVAGITLGGLLTFGVLDTPDFFVQLTWFFGLTVGWTIVLWFPLKKYLRSSTGKFDIYAGTIATVKEGGISRDKSGKVRWSGTDMRARIIDSSSLHDILEDTEVYVYKMKDGVMYVDVVAPDSNKK